MSNGHRSGRSTGRITTTEPDMTFFNFIIIFFDPGTQFPGNEKKYAMQYKKSTKIKLEWTLTESRFLPHEVYETNKSSILRVFTFQKRDFLRFFEMTCQKLVQSRQQKLSPQSFEMSSHTSLVCDLYNSSGFVIGISKQLAFETKKLAGLWR